MVYGHLLEGPSVQVLLHHLHPLFSLGRAGVDLDRLDRRSTERVDERARRARGIRGVFTSKSSEKIRRLESSIDGDLGSIHWFFLCVKKRRNSWIAANPCTQATTDSSKILSFYKDVFPIIALFASDPLWSTTLQFFSK